MTRWVVMPIVTLFAIVKIKVKIINMKYVESEVSAVAWMIEISWVGVVLVQEMTQKSVEGSESLCCVVNPTHVPITFFCC